MANFGAGVVVSSVTVNSATTATVVLNIDPAAAAGIRNVTLTTGAEAVNLPNGFTVTNGSPVLTQVSPNTGQQGQQSLSVALTGQFTHFVQGTTTANFGTGITAAALTVTSLTTATAVINIDSAATLGAHNVSLTTNTEIAALTNGFTVTAGTPIISQVNPNTGQQGQTLTGVAFTGAFTHFTQATPSVTFSNTGIAASAIQVTDNTHLTATLTIAANAATGASNVTVVTGAENANGAGLFSVGASAAVITTVAPATGQQGQQNLSVAITGQFTHFVQGTTVAGFGAGITVNSTTVADATHATANIIVAANAAIGVRAVIMTTGSEVATLANGFTVQSVAPSITTMNPPNGQQGQTLAGVQITGTLTHFAQAMPTVTFSSSGVTASNVTVTDDTHLAVTLTIAANSTIGLSNVTVVTGSETATGTGLFTVTTGTSTITSVAPNSGQQGQVLASVAIAGQLTHFVQGTTVANFGAGVTVNSTTVTDATHARANIAIAPNAATGGRVVTIATGTEVVTLPNGFTVTAGTPAITNVNPNTGPQGATNVAVTITGAFTHFSSSSIVTFGNTAVTAGTPTAATATSITVPVSITAAAAAGATNVIVTTGSEVVTLTNGFTVTNGAPMISNVNPNTGPQGAANVAVTITGTFTHFDATSVVSFGNVAVTASTPSAATATSLTVPVSITAAAALGATSVVVTTGAEVVTLANGFTVNNGTPMITNVSPNTGPEGASSVPVTITGAFTHFGSSSVVTFANGAVTAGAPTAATATSLTVPVSITGAATVGATDLTVTTGAEAVTLTGGFTVTGGAPVITGVNPNNGQPGASSLPVTITGSFTHFSSSSVVTFSNSAVTAGAPTAATATSITVPISIGALAVLGATNLTVTTGSEIASLASAFTVTAGTPTLLTAAPGTVKQGQSSASVTLTGQYTHFAQGTTTANFGNGVTVASLTVNSLTSATATLNIDPLATVGTRSLTVTTGAEVVSLANAINVQAGPPVISLTSPANLSYFNISPTTINGTVSDPAATVTINSISAPNANGQFSVQVPLAEGPNILIATATGAGGTGTASIQVTLDTTPPHVTITSPPDQFVTTAASISVSGSINDTVVGTVNSSQAQVTVNGATAQVANRTFLASSVPLNLGSNVIQAVGRDQAGNSATTQVTVTRQAPPQAPQIQLISGNNQSGIIGSALSSPLVVSVTDAMGNPLPNTPVIFKVTQDNGMVAVGSPPAASAVATTNAQGHAQAQWTIGMRAGAGSDRVEAYAVGVSGTAIFGATATQGPAGKIVIDSGNDQIGPINQPLPKPLVAVVVDEGNNRLANVPVTFTVSQGGGGLGIAGGTNFTLQSNGSYIGQPTITVNTDSDGRAAAALILGFQEGNANNLVTADFPGDTGFAASFTASGRAEGNAANTLITGVVLDNSNVPIPGVTVRAVLTNLLNSNSGTVNAAATVQTDAQGQFSIPQAPVGFVKLLIDGSTAQRTGTYPTLDYDLVSIAGQTNTVGQPIYLLPLNPANQLCVTATTGGGTLTIPEAPGFSLTFAPGQVTFPGGSKQGCVSVTAVHPDKVPMLPGFGQQPRFIVTIQPSGALFNPPAPITLPNVDGLKPREVTEMYSFDHDIGQFVAIGTGSVSDDGQVIRSNPGIGVLKAGWHCGGNPTTSGAAATCPICFFCSGSLANCQPQGNGTSCGNGGTCQFGAGCVGGHGPTCPAGQNFNSLTGFCVNSGACAPGFTFNAGQCCPNGGGTCVQPSCSPGQLIVNGQCVNSPCNPSLSACTTGNNLPGTCNANGQCIGNGGGGCNPPTTANVNGVCVVPDCTAPGASAGILCNAGGNAPGMCTSNGQGGLVCQGTGNQCSATCNGGTCINGVCQDVARFVSMRTTTSPVNFTFEQDNDQFVLRAGSHLLSIPGAAFQAQANISPTVPGGTLEFVQLVNTDRRITFSDNSVLLRNSAGAFVLDTIDPYPTQATSTPAPNIVQIATNDSPSQGLGGLENEIVKVEIHESFQMYFTFRPQSAARYTLGRAVWAWDPVLQKNSSGNFAIISGTQVFGLDGVETADPVAPSGTSCQLRWMVDDTHSTRTPSSADNALTQVPQPCP